MVYYFSGQGNSRAAAIALGKALGMEICRITRREIDNAHAAEPPTPDEASVWVFPVHAWGVPRVVEEFIERLASDTPDGGAGSVHHMVATCGDDIGRTDRLWAAMIRARGWRVGGVFSLTMPNTYVCLPGFDTDSAELAADKLDSASAGIEAIASRIADNRADGMRQVTPGSMPWAKATYCARSSMRFLCRRADFVLTEENAIHAESARRCVRWIISRSTAVVRDGAVTARCVWHAITAVLTTPSDTDVSRVARGGYIHPPTRFRP